MPRHRGDSLVERIEAEPDQADRLVRELIRLVATLHSHARSIGAITPRRARIHANGFVGLASTKPIDPMAAFDDEDWPFVAPEAAQGHPTDERSDVYSLGAWLALTKRHDAIAQRARDPDPAKRFANAHALADAIGAPTQVVRQDEADVLFALAREKASLLKLLTRQADATKDPEVWRKTRKRIAATWSEVGGLSEAWLALSPTDARARRVRADFAFRRARDAEQDADPEGLILALTELEQYDDGAREEYLRGEGAATILTEPTGATMTLFQLTPRGTGFVANRRGLPQRTPFDGKRLPAGSWEARIERQGHAPVRYPFHVARGEAWSSTPPGRTAPSPIPLPKADDIKADEIFVPGGWCRVGGDHDAPGSGRAAWAWVDGFVVQKWPVTHELFLEFLNSLIRQRRQKEAERIQPRLPSAGKGTPLYVRGFANALDLPTKAGDMVTELKHPVVCIDRAAIEQFALWHTVRTGHRWRLPTEVEWEKTARGADGRAFPWGSAFDGSKCTTAERGLRSPPLIHDLVENSSPYGVCGLAGGVREWTSSEWSPDGVALGTDGRPPSGTTAEDDVVALVARGSSFLEGRSLARCAARSRVDVHARQLDLGFRLVRTFSPG